MSRILLKLSGEALAGDKHHGFDEATVIEVAKQVKQIVDKGTQVGIVQLRLRQMVFTLPKQLTEYMTVIQRPILLQRSMMSFQSKRLLRRSSQ